MSPGRSLGARLYGSLATMLLPLVVLGVVGLVDSDLRAIQLRLVIVVLLGTSACAAAILAHRLHRFVTDMVERLDESREQLRHQAFHDALTGLPNRELFNDRTRHAVARATSGRYGDRQIAVLFLDLDDFKGVNDSLGHGAGDRLLTTVAARLRETVRVEDTIARLGGDEFAVLLEDVPDVAHAERAARRLLDALASPIPLGEHRVTAGASIGVALSSPDADTAEALLRNADVAMYAAKNAGRGQYRIYEDGMVDAALQRMILIEELRTAMKDDQLHLEYQPVLDLDTDRIVSVEALLRWYHPVCGVVPPCDFIPLAEETRLILPIGRWVIREAARQAAELQLLTGDAEPVTVAVNLSPYQLEDPGLVDDVADAIADAGIDPSLLVLELTESEMTADLDAAAPVLFALKDLGVRLALDDIGTGHSRWSYLRSFPVDILKLDRELIASDSGGDARLTRALLGLGRELELQTVAEGIERPDQLAHLKELGCTLGQGFLFARPMGADELCELLAGASPVSA